MANPKIGEYRSSIIFNREVVKTLRENDISIQAFIRNAMNRKVRELKGEIISSPGNGNVEKLNNRIEALNTQVREQIQILDKEIKEKTFWKELCEKFVKDLELNEKETEVVMKWLN